MRKLADWKVIDKKSVYSKKSSEDETYIGLGSSDRAKKRSLRQPRRKIAKKVTGRSAEQDKGELLYKESQQARDASCQTAGSEQRIQA